MNKCIPNNAMNYHSEDSRNINEDKASELILKRLDIITTMLDNRCSEQYTANIKIFGRGPLDDRTSKCEEAIDNVSGFITSINRYIDIIFVRIEDLRRLNEQLNTF